MKYTNRLGLSDEFVHWLKSDDYDYNPDLLTMSATTLMKPTRMIVLEERWADALTVDVSDLISSRYGSALHDSFEKCKIPNAIQEVRYYREFEGFRISGKVDMLLDIDKPIQRLGDLKSTSVWNYLLTKKDDDYIMQLSIYKWILEANGFNVADKAVIKFLFTDWSKKDSLQNHNYPQSRANEKELKLLSSEDVEAYIFEKVAAVKEARSNPDFMLPDCTQKELWQTDTTYAVIKKGAKRATKVFNTLREAIGMTSKNPDYYYQQRNGKAKRCGYCSVRQYCSQYESLLSQNLID